jgi:KDO2-lipid IV(A) lauroyltransferase
MARHETPDVRDRLEYAALSALLAAYRLPSRERAMRWGRDFGRFAARCVPLRREVALTNLRLAFPEKSEEERRAVYRGMLENLGLVLASFARFEREPRDPIADVMRLVHPEAFAEVHRAGRGAILLSAHFGDWEALVSTVAAAGYPVTTLGGRQRNPLVEDLFARYRTRMGVGAITVGKSLKPILVALRRGDFVATLADQDGGSGGFFIDFLGRPASVQPGLFRLAARTGVPLVTGFAVREGDGWRGELQPPLIPAAATSPEAVEAEARRLAVHYTALVETYVRRHPDHWFWVHRRWRTRPPKERGGA